MTEITYVTEVETDQIQHDDIIWAPDDGDWLTVDRIYFSKYGPDVIFFRRDGSEASFDQRRKVLRQTAAASPEGQEQCSRCKEFFPVPVELHHAEQDCVVPWAEWNHEHELLLAERDPTNPGSLAYQLATLALQKDTDDNSF